MDYTDTDGNPATGVVWSPGPLPGTVWVLSHSGASASEACCVDISKRTQVTDEDVARRRGHWNFDHYAREGNADRRLSTKDWHAALGFDPVVVVGIAETLSGPSLFEVA